MNAAADNVENLNAAIPAPAQPSSYGRWPWLTANCPATPEQIRAIVAAGRRLGIDLDGLRGLTPRGSISKLTRAQASDLLDRLNARMPNQPGTPSGPEAAISGGGGASPPSDPTDFPKRRRRRSSGALRIASVDARRYLRDLWSADVRADRVKLAWLARYFGVESIEEVASASLCWKITEALKSILAQQQTRPLANGVATCRAQP